MKKFLITFLALGLVSTLSCFPSEEARTRIENQRFFDIFGAFTKVVDQLIKTVQNKLNELINQTGVIVLGGISNINNAIVEAIADFSFQLQNVQDEINQLVDSQVKPCLEDLNVKIVDVQNETISDLLQCYEDGRSNFDEISEFLANYTIKNNQEIQTVRNKIQECIDEPNFGEKVKCAVDAATAVREASESYVKNIDDTARGIFTTITLSVNKTFLCIDEKSQNGQNKLDEIIDGVIQCLESNESTTTEDSTSSDGDSSSTVGSTTAEDVTSDNDDSSSTIGSTTAEDATFETTEGSKK